MADFNPQIPFEDSIRQRPPEPISQPMADKSGGLYLNAAGEALKDGTKLAFNTMKEFIKEDTRNTVEPIRKDFTNDLIAARDQLIPAPVQTSSGVKVGLPFADESEGKPELPPAITKGIDQIKALNLAFQQGKGVNDTYYHMKLDQAVTGLRTKYPGFVDEIDADVSKITGGIPANQVISDLMQDINRTQTGKKTEQEKTAEMILKSGFDGAYSIYNKYMANPNDPKIHDEVVKWYTDEAYKDTKDKRDSAYFNNRKAGKDAVGSDRYEALQDRLERLRDSDLNKTLTLSGMTDSKSILGLIKDLSENPEAYTTPQKGELATRLNSQIGVLRAQWKLIADQNGFTKDVGETKTKEAIEGTLDFYKSLADTIKGGGPEGVGTFYFALQQGRAFHDDRMLKYKSSDLADYTEFYKAITDDLGPAGAVALNPLLMGDKAKVPARLGAYVNRLTAEARSGLPADPKNPAAPVATFNDHVTDIQNDKRLSPVEKAALSGGVADVVKDLKNKDMAPLWSKEIQYFFSPGNDGVLRKFNKDRAEYTTDESGHRIMVEHPGRQKIWKDATDGEIVKNIATLGDVEKNTYRSWVNLTGRDLIGEEVKTLSSLTGHANLYFEWHGDRPNDKLVLRDKEGGLDATTKLSRGGAFTQNMNSPAQADINEAYRQKAQRLVDRINPILSNLDNVYSKLGGGSTEEAVLQTLQQYGMDFEGKVSGLPKAFGDAVAASRKAPKPKEEK